MLVTKEWEMKKVYSMSKDEHVREMLGERLNNISLEMPTKKQKLEHPQCRWIILCTKSGNRFIPSVEKVIRLWKEACDIAEFGFWSSTVIEDGLYYIVDGSLLKASESDTGLKRKINNL